jgi:hypothetical protein
MGSFPGSDQEKMAAWNTGVRFGSSAEFTRLWNAALIKALLKSDPANYNPVNREALVGFRGGGSGGVALKRGL